MRDHSVSKARRAVFLDREGTLLNNHNGHVTSEAEVEFLPGALDATRVLAQTDRIIILVTNQSPVSRKMISHGDALALNSFVARRIVSAGGRIDATYLCPHQDGDGCACRKPRSGMLLQAKEELVLDLSASIVIGDSLGDLELAVSVDALAILVLTGNGERARRSLGGRPDLVASVTICPDLRRAADLVTSL